MNTGVMDINLLGILLFAVMIFDGKRSGRVLNNRFFYRTIVFFLLSLVAGILYHFTGNITWQVAYPFHYFITMAYLLFSVIGGYYWLIFTCHELWQDIPIHFFVKVLSFLPILFLSIIVLCSPFTHWIFYMNEKNQHTQSSLFLLQNIIVYGYILTGAVTSFIQFRKVTELEKQKNSMQLFIYSLITLLGKGIEFLFPQLHIATSALIISIIMLYLGTMKKEIQLDSLTQLNNRRQFEQHLVRITKSAKSEKIYLIFFDINNFKIINDTYGHMEGDKALILVAQVIKTVFSNTKAFLSRYGGDEFAVILAIKEGEVLPYLQQIDHSLVELSANLPYTLSLSVGYSIYGEENATTIETFVQTADKKMYSDKEEKKKNHTKNVSQYRA